MKRHTGNRVIMLVLAVVVAGTAGASPDRAGVAADDVLEAYPFLDGTTVSDLTVNELLTIAEQVSVQRQERAYVMRTAGSSLLLPGLGQFFVGETWRGVAHLTAGVAIAGGSLYGAYALLPDDFRDILGDKSAVESYFDEWRPELLPSVGVLVGGMLLGGINTMWSVGGAASTATEQIRSGEVVFEPNLAMIGLNFGIGGRIRY